MGKSEHKMKSKEQGSISKMPANLIGTTISPSKSGKPQIVKNKFKEEYNEGTVLVEIPECRRTIFVEKKAYFLSFPKIRFFISYIRQRNGAYASRFFRMCFVHNKKKTILVPPLPNLFGDLKVCCPGAKGNTLEQLIDNQIEVLFSSQFNDETWETFEEYYEDDNDYDDDEMQSVVKYLKKWMKKTKTNPKWVPKKFPEYAGYDNDFINENDDY